jgi:hypothetical protein
MELDEANPLASKPPFPSAYLAHRNTLKGTANKKKRQNFRKELLQFPRAIQQIGSSEEA